MALVMALPLAEEGPTGGNGLWCALTEGEATLWRTLEEEKASVWHLLLVLVPLLCQSQARYVVIVFVYVCESGGALPQPIATAYNGVCSRSSSTSSIASPATWPTPPPNPRVTNQGPIPWQVPCSPPSMQQWCQSHSMKWHPHLVFSEASSPIIEGCSRCRPCHWGGKFTTCMRGINYKL